MLDGLLDWLGALSPGALYAALAVTAGIENVFPPLPADTVVAFGSFAAARGAGSAFGVFAATLVGNLGGAMAMYWVGRRYGSERAMSRLGGDAGRERLQRWYDRYGLGAIVVSRFLPGVRAIVPPFAGALRIGAVRSMVAMGVASAAWYGAITYLAFHAGANFGALQSRIVSGQRISAVVAGAIVVIGAAIWLVRRGRRTSR